MNAEAAKRQFLEYIEIERGRAVKTIENYDHYLTRYFTQMGIKSAGDITEESVRAFRLWLNRQPGMGTSSMKRRTQNYYMIALRAFLKFLRKRGIECLSPERIELAKLPERELDLISPAELEGAFAASDVVYPSTGEVILEANEPLPKTVINKFRVHNIGFFFNTHSPDVFVFDQSFILVES